MHALYAFSNQTGRFLYLYPATGSQLNRVKWNISYYPAVLLSKKKPHSSLCFYSARSDPGNWRSRAGLYSGDLPSIRATDWRAEIRETDFLSAGKFVLSGY